MIPAYTTTALQQLITVWGIVRKKQPPNLVLQVISDIFAGLKKRLFYFYFKQSTLDF